MNLENGVLQVHIEDIIPNRFQPRLNFDEQGLKELSDSIKEHGIIQPLVLRKLGNKYEIIAGERRYKAAQMAGLQTVPAVVANIDDNTSAEVALVENVQRRDLTAIEEARSYKSLLDKGYLTQEQLAKRMGLSQPSIANKLRLLNLDDEVQQALLDEKISERHARTLLSIDDKQTQREWLHRIINERLTVRQLDLEIKKSKGEEAVPLVEKNKTVEEIRSSAKDINPKKDPRVGEYKPREEIETLDFNTNEKEIIPEVETYNDFDISSDLNIKTPNTTSDLIDSAKTPTSDNKFFNIFNNDAFVTEENIPTPSNSKPEMEIYNDSTNPSITITKEKEPVRPKEETPIIQDTYLGKEPEIQLSSDNVFLVPPIEENKNVEINNPKQIIDPMDVVNFISNKENPVKEPGKYELHDAVTDIRDLLNDLEDKGFTIEIDEAALESEYDINIKIKKDN